LLARQDSHLGQAPEDRVVHAGQTIARSCTADTSEHRARSKCSSADRSTEHAKGPAHIRAQSALKVLEAQHQSTEHAKGPAHIRAQSALKVLKLRSEHR